MSQLLQANQHPSFVSWKVMGQQGMSLGWLISAAWMWLISAA
jgi:hypothetical protein